MDRSGAAARETVSQPDAEESYGYRAAGNRDYEEAACVALWGDKQGRAKKVANVHAWLLAKSEISQTPEVRAIHVCIPMVHAQPSKHKVSRSQPLFPGLAEDELRGETSPRRRIKSPLIHFLKSVTRGSAAL